MIGYEKYARTDIETSDPRAVIVLLYEGGIRFLNEALSACRANRRLEVSNNVNRTLKIVQFLSNALNFEVGGEVAENLSRLYVYVRDTLLQANLMCDAEKIEEARNLFKILLDGWREVAHDPETASVVQSRVPESASAPPPEAESRVARAVNLAHEPESPPPTHHAPYGEEVGSHASAHAPTPVVSSPELRVAGQSAYGIRQVG
ncbi:flagellar export chaperone FliS [Candidatus Sumerlaeota bacterium]|nr:flagellar export chaperone FliS [Candidatus Sumerlaeota bacterium]